MSGETSEWSIANGEWPPETDDTLDVAIGDLVPLTLALTSEIAKLAYPDAVRSRCELELALARVHVLAETLSGVSERAEALQRLAKMRTVAELMLAIAPAPSSAAIEAAEAGDTTAWHLEEQAWIASRLAGGSSPHLPLRRRYRRDTRPESPRALRVAPGDGADAPNYAAARAPDRAPHKAGT